MFGSFNSWPRHDSSKLGARSGHLRLCMTINHTDLHFKEEIAQDVLKWRKESFVYCS